jgi:hypothetical protein
MLPVSDCRLVYKVESDLQGIRYVFPDVVALLSSVTVKLLSLRAPFVHRAIYIAG